MSVARSGVARVVRTFRGGDAAARFLGVQVGEGSRVLTTYFGSEPWLIEIGSRTTVSSEVKFLTHDGVGWLFRDEFGRRFKYGRVIVGDDCFIGLGSILMPGIRVGDRAVVGAGSVVTRSVQADTVVAGNPARVISTRRELFEVVSKWPSDRDAAGLRGRTRIQTLLDAYDSQPLT